MLYRLDLGRGIKFCRGTGQVTLIRDGIYLQMNVYLVREKLDLFDYV